MSPRLTRLTRPLVRDRGELRDQPPGTRRSIAPRPASGRSLDEGASTGLFSCSKTTNELNFATQKFSRVARHSTTSIAATAPDTLLASSVWRRCSVLVAAPAPTELRGRGPDRPVGFERARDAPDLLPPPAAACTSGAKLYAVDPRRTSAQWADCGWASTSVPTSRSRTRSGARSSYAGLANESSSLGRPAATSVPRAGRALHARVGERGTGVPAAGDRELAHAFGDADAMSAGRSGSPSTTTRSTTSSR